MLYEDRQVNLSKRTGDLARAQLVVIACPSLVLWKLDLAVHAYNLRRQGQRDCTFEIIADPITS